MRDKFINIGNKAFVNMDKVKYIVSADAEKVRRELAKRNLTRSHKEVFDGTSAKETRSMLIFDDNSIGISGGIDRKSQSAYRRIARKRSKG